MLIRHTLIYFISRVITGASALVGIWLFTRLFPPEIFGEYVGCVAFASFLNIILFDWLRKAYQRQVPGHTSPQQLAGAMLAIFLAQVLGVGSIALLFYLWSTALAIFVAQTLMLTLALASSDLSLEKLRSLLWPAHYLAFSVFRDVAQIALVIILLQSGLESKALVLAQIIAYILPVFIWGPFLWRGVYPKFFQNETKSLLSYGMPLVFNYSLSAFLNNGDRLLLTALASSTAIGFYGAASGMARQSITLLMQSVNLAAAPLAFRAGLDKSGAGAIQQLSQNLLLLLLVGLPATVGLSVLALPLSELVLGPSYVSDAATLLPWAACAALLYGLRTFYTDHAFYMSDKTQLLWRNALFCCFLSIPVYVFLILNFAAKGAGWAAVINGLISLCASWVTGRRIFALPLPVRDITWICLATIICGAVAWLFVSFISINLAGLILAVFAAGAAYCAVILAGNVLFLRDLIRQKILGPLL
jgi:O-antigen/teichoic acid export membrane protein